MALRYELSSDGFEFELSRLVLKLVMEFRAAAVMWLARLDESLLHPVEEARARAA